MVEYPENKRAANGVAIAGIVAAAAVFVLIGREELQPSSIVTMDYALEHGAEAWPPSTRAAFLQDPANQWPMTEAQQEARARQGASRWRPPAAQCHYLSRFIAVIERYELDTDDRQMARLKAQRQRCYTQFQ